MWQLTLNCQLTPPVPPPVVLGSDYTRKAPADPSWTFLPNFSEIGHHAVLLWRLKISQSIIHVLGPNLLYSLLLTALLSGLGDWRSGVTAI